MHVPIGMFFFFVARNRPNTAHHCGSDAKTLQRRNYIGLLLYMVICCCVKLCMRVYMVVNATFLFFFTVFRTAVLFLFFFCPCYIRLSLLQCFLLLLRSLFKCCSLGFLHPISFYFPDVFSFFFFFAAVVSGYVCFVYTCAVCTLYIHKG